MHLDGEEMSCMTDEEVDSSEAGDYRGDKRGWRGEGEEKR